MNFEEILLDVEDRMEKAVARLKRDLTGIRTGRANPGLVDSIKVEAYGASTPMKQVATIACPEANQIVIRPFDLGTIKDIEKAIIASDLGYTPNNDGRVIRINIPPLSTQVRQKMVSRIKELTEETKIAIRNVRRDGNKMAETAEKNKEITEDIRDKTKEEIQELTKKFEDETSELAKNREKEVMEN
ncbi:MAG: ribosome recycling factor [Planctomycetaceae bacterium]|jgi:ribosome recycling factor|nr:ribosome recycling factor [Planctomycetaceae bacterium]